jgi:hypothetical protein
VKVKSGSGSVAEQAYGMPKAMRRVLGEGGGLGIRGARGAG